MGYMGSCLKPGNVGYVYPCLVPGNMDYVCSCLKPGNVDIIYTGFLCGAGILAIWAILALSV